MKKILYFISCAIVLGACNNSSTKVSNSANSSTDSVAQQTELVLNNGAKWKANAETNKGIEKMQKLVADYLISANNNNVALSESLNGMFTEILEACTMEGEAHEQLHHFLMPLKTKIDMLKEKGGQEEVSSLQYYLANYHQYFE
jgi:hypothetical protein